MARAVVGEMAMAGDGVLDVAGDGAMVQERAWALAGAMAWAMEMAGAWVLDRAISCKTLVSGSRPLVLWIFCFLDSPSKYHNLRLWCGDVQPMDAVEVAAVRTNHRGSTSEVFRARGMAIHNYQHGCVVLCPYPD